MRNMRTEERRFFRSIHCNRSVAVSEFGVTFSWKTNIIARSQVLTAAIVTWQLSGIYSLVEVDQRFRDGMTHPDNGGSTHFWKVGLLHETRPVWRCIPEGCHLQTSWDSYLL